MKCLKNSVRRLAARQGFSLVEVLVSIGAFGLFAITVQSVLVIGHSFKVSHTSLMDVLQSTRMIKTIICQANSSFRSSNMDLSKTYLSKTSSHNKREYYRHPLPHPPATPFLTLDLEGIETETARGVVGKEQKKFIEKQEKIPDVTKFSSARKVEFLGPDHKKPHYYKLFQDSHTLVKLNLNKEAFSIPRSGYIFASRCIENKKSNLIGAGGAGPAGTFDPDQKALKSSALYILEQAVRPYYFPHAVKPEPLIKCCLGGASPNCTGSALLNLKQFVPRFYILHFKIDQTWTPPLTHQSGLGGAFFASVEHIQEEPEWHDINNVWGAGFMLSTKTVLRPHQSTGFRLDVMFLKNSCKSSPVRLTSCPSLAFGTNPASQVLSTHSQSGPVSRKHTLKDFINSDTTSCSGHSSSKGSSSLIHL